jgi:hypothetical protein
MNTDTKKYEEAKFMSENFNLILLKEGRKNPIEEYTGWNDLKRTEEDKERMTDITLEELKEGNKYNYGVVVRKDKNIVLDFDDLFKEENKKKFKGFKETFKNDLETLTVRTASNGYHFYFKTSKYLYEQLQKLGRTTGETKNLYGGYLDIKQGGEEGGEVYLVGPECKNYNVEDYINGYKKEFRYNAYEIENKTKPIEISSNIVDYLIKGFLEKEENQTVKPTTRSKKEKKEKKEKETANRVEDIDDYIEKIEKIKRIRKNIRNIKQKELNYLRKILNILPNCDNNKKECEKRCKTNEKEKYEICYYDYALKTVFSLGSTGNEQIKEMTHDIMKKCFRYNSKDGYRFVEHNFTKNDNNIQRAIQEVENLKNVLKDNDTEEQKEKKFNENITRKNLITFEYVLNRAYSRNEEIYNQIVEKVDDLTENNLEIDYKLNKSKILDDEFNIQIGKNENDLIDYETYERRYIKEYDIVNHDIHAIKSPMGTGKTTALTNLIKQNNYERIIWFSPRIIYSNNKQEEINNLIEGSKDGNAKDCLKFYNYKDLNDGELDKVNRLFISLESLYKLDKQKQYSLVIIDETETILNTFSSPTMDKNKKQIKNNFIKILKNSNKIILNDAFISNRTKDFLIDIKGEREKINTLCDDEDDIIEKEERAKKKIKITENKIVLNKKKATIFKNRNLIMRNLLEDLQEGKKLIIHSTSKRELDKVNNALKERGFKTLYYNSSMDDGLKFKSSKNINEEWLKYDCILYTPSITIGIDFNIKGFFYRKYFFGCPHSCLTRDSIQALDRVRFTITGEIFIHFIGNSNNKKSFYETTDGKYNRIIKERKRENQALRNIYLGLLKKSIKTNDWLERVLKHNEIEEMRNNACYSFVFRKYLELLNYDIEYDNTIDKKEYISTENVDSNFKYEDIEDINEKEVMNLKFKKEKTEYEKRQLEKYFFDKNFKDINNKEKLKFVFNKYWDTSRKSSINFIYYDVNYLLESHIKEGIFNQVSDIEKISKSKYNKEFKELLNLLGFRNCIDTHHTIHTDTLTKNITQIRELVNGLMYKFKIRDFKKQKTKDEKDLITDVKKIISKWTDGLVVLKGKHTTKNGENVYKWALDKKELKDFNFVNLSMKKQLHIKTTPYEKLDIMEKDIKKLIELKDTLDDCDEEIEQLDNLMNL